jgi:anti-sigma factor RsiW
MAESHQHITCQEVVELVTGYLDGALPDEEASLFEQHLNFCDGCVWYVDQLRATVAAAARLSEEDVPADTREQLLTAFRDWRRP